MSKLLRAAIVVGHFALSLQGQAAGVSIAANDPQLRYTGRVDFTTPTAPRFAWPGVMIEAAFSGTSIGIRLSEQLGGYNNYFDAIIDGSSSPQRITSSSAAIVQYDVTGLAAGFHTLKLVRRSESFNGASTGQENSNFHGFTLEAGQSLQSLAPAPARKIEIIGDSLSVGYGLESPGQSCPGTVSAFTNNDKAYGSIVARNFCAEVHSSAVSGHGMVHNYNDVQVSAYPLPALYNRTLPGAAAPLYNVGSWPADAVVIFLGTNDYSNINPPTQLQYENAYKALIADIRAQYAPGNPWIFCLYGSNSPVFGPYVQNVVSYENSTLSDPRVVAVNMGVIGTSSCDWHPSVAEHQAMATTLSSAIQAATGWAQGSCATPTVTLTPTPSATPGGPGKDYCVHLDYSALPALLNHRKVTLKVNVGTCSSVSVMADGSPIPATYAAGIATFSTTASDIIVTANGWTSGGTGVATKALLHNDRRWAHSLTFDDGIKVQYDNARPLLDAKGWDAGVAIIGSGQDGANPWNMSWAEAQALRASGWDIFNHSYTHPTITCANFVAEFGNNQSAFLTRFPGYNVTHVVYPFENTGASLCGTWPPAYILSGEGGGGTNYVDAAFPNAYRLARSTLYGSSSSAWQTAAAAAAGNARPVWMINITHGVAAGAGAPADAYSTNAAALGAYLDYLEANFGASGNNSMWFAPAGEVSDYIMTRDNVVITTPSCGTPTPTPTACGACTNTFTATQTLTPTQTPTATPLPACSALLIDTLEDGNAGNQLGGFWAAYGDAPATATAADPLAAGYPASPNGALYALRSTGNNIVSGYLHVGTISTTFAPSIDLAGKDRLIFWIKGSGGGTGYRVNVDRAAVADYDNYGAAFTAPAGVWTRIEILLSSMAQAGWGATVAPGWSDVTGLTFFNSSAGAWDISLDDIEFGCPAPPTSTRTITATRTQTGTLTPSRTASPTLSVTPSRSQTAQSTATVTSSNTPSFSPTPSITQTFSPVPPGSTMTATPSQSPTPSTTPSVSSSSTPSRTAINTATVSATASASVTALATQTASPQASNTASATLTPLSPGSATSTQTTTATVTSTALLPGGTATFSPTPTFSPTSTETVVVNTPVSTATAASNGALQILDQQPVPNPNPNFIALHLNGPADSIELRVYSVGEACIAVVHSGPALGGWNQVPLPGGFSNGLHYVRAVAKRGELQSLPVKPLRVLVLR